MEESLDPSETLIETLRTRGWFLGDLEQVRAVIMICSALADDPSTVVDSLESELMSMDLRSFGGKSLPDLTLLRKSSHLLGPKVLQISAVRDILKSSIDGFSKNSDGHRLLRLSLTDGHTEITAIEYSHIPEIPDDIVPGTKVRLENRAPIRNGIICLNSKVISVLGGVVKTLYDEWEMNQKYSGFSRLSVTTSQEGDTSGPPPFEKFQIGASSHRLFKQDRSSDYKESTSKSSRPTATAAGNTEVRPMRWQQRGNGKAGNIMYTASFTEWTEEKPSSYETRPKEESTSRSSTAIARNTEIRPTGGQERLDGKPDNDMKTASATDTTEEKASISDTRPRGVVEVVPVQNQAAAQKLLQKMNQQNGYNRHFKSGRNRGKGKSEDQEYLTLDEYEKRKAGAKQFQKDEYPNIRHDEDLAWQLQNQFDLEDSHVQMSAHKGEAENIRMSMFSYERDSDTVHGMGSTGRGGRGRGRRRGRGRW